MLVDDSRQRQRHRVDSYASAQTLPGRLETERAHILSTILTAGTVVSGTMLVLAPLWREEPLGSFIGYGLTFLLHISHLWLVRRGHARFAARSFSILFFVMVTIMVYSYGGIRGLGGFVYPLAALFTGLTWSAWAAVGVAMAASATALGMALAESGGLMTTVAPTPSAGGAWAVITASVAMTAVMLVVALRVIRTSTMEAVESERQRRLLETELARAKRMEALGQLAGGVAHDFNNMLTGIIGHAELIGRKTTPGSDVARHAGLILSSGEKAAQVTRQLLTFSRKQDRVIEDVHTHDIIRNVVAILEPSLNRTIQIRTELDADPDVIHGDPAQLEMALLNLAVNARDALSSGGSLVFRTSRQPARDEDAPSFWLRIDVSDTGSGMTEEVREHIFEPYYTTKPSSRGTGLGLAAVYGTVQNHHGRISVESEVNQGTRFTIHLPAATGQLAPVEPRTTIPHPSRTRSVLAIDDDDVVLELLRGLLEDLGHTLKTATSGDEGLAIYTADPGMFDLVIVDLVMPQLSGREVLRALNRHSEGRQPIIITSGAIDEVLEAPELGANVKFLAKPYRRAELIHLIGELTGPSDTQNADRVDETAVKAEGDDAPSSDAGSA